MRFTLLPERFRVGVESPEQPEQFAVAHPLLHPPFTDRRGIRRFFRTIAPETTAMIGRAQGIAPGLRHRAKAWRTMGDQSADDALPLAFHANAVARDVGFPSVEKRVHDFQQLKLIDRATAQLKIDEHVIGNGSGLCEYLEIGRT